jgi:[protein-PII] uridylyltransferase
MSMGYAERRDELIGSGLRGTKLRTALSDAADAWLTRLLGPAPGVALVAVGGYGRADLSPGSDLDVLLLHDGSRGEAALRDIADGVWYPVWDSKVKLDHSVRTVAEARAVARDDLPAALGLLTARHIAGDQEFTARLRTAARADWRADAPRRLPEVRAVRTERLELHGELAYRLEGDLKEAIGGLRDANALTAIAASWLADVPHGEPEAARTRLVDIRDALHITTGRSADRLLLQEQDDVAAQLGLSGADELLGEVADAARTIAYACDVAWRRVEHVLAERTRTAHRTAERTPLADGVVAADGEVTLALAADPARDPILVLRAAAAAAAAGLPFAPAGLRRLVEHAGPLPTPWPRPAREEFIRLVGAGPGLVAVWEALDRTGLLTRLLPEWERIRSLPQRNALHVHTVDRHLVQTAVHAATRTRRVSRPDLLLTAAVCHDLGKGLAGDHSETGARIVAELVPRLGFGAADTAVLAALVRHHLLLAELAVHRDHDDPATVSALLTAAQVPGGSVGPGEFVALLHALTEADSEATGPAVWNRWRANLIAGLADRAVARLAGQPHPSGPAFDGSVLAARAATSPDRLAILALAPGTAGVARLDVALPDRPGVLSLVAGVLSLRRVRILAAEVETMAMADTGTGRWALQRWTVAAEYGELPDIARLRTDLRSALAGRLDLAERMAAREAEHRPIGRLWPPQPPVVTVLENASTAATVVEVRAGDTPGLLHRVTAAIAVSGADIVTARIATLGAEAIDVFYITDSSTGMPLNPAPAAGVAEHVRLALR